MKPILKFVTCIFLSGIIFFISCKKITDQVTPTPNRPPIAKAGPDQTITLPNNTVTLDGSASTDPDNNITNYAWTVISGPSSFTIANKNAVQTQVTNLAEGVYQFELKVTDAGILSSKDNILVTVNAAVTVVACDNSNRLQVNAQLIPFGTLSKGRTALTLASAGNKILFAGGSWSSDCPECWGSSRVDIYDVVTKAWSTAELKDGRRGIAAITVGNKIFFGGGENGDGAFDQLYSTVDIYDASTNTWSVASLSVPRCNMAAATVGDKVIFAGGEYNWNYDNTNQVDIYNISTNTWSTSQLVEARSYISAVTVNQKIYFAGGEKEDRWYAQPSNRIDIYDNVTNSWSTSNLSKPMGFIGGIAAGNNIYWNSECTVEIKDVNTWNSSLANLSKPGKDLFDGSQIVIKDNKLVFFKTGGETDKFDIYDIASNSWSIGVLSQLIPGNASIISVNNIIYVAGGIVSGSPSNQVWKLEF